MTGWRALLRLAWRDLLRHKGRTLLVLFMIGLPVLGVTAADVLASTASVDRREGIERKVGTADALVGIAEGRGRVEGQSVDGQDMGGPPIEGKAPTIDQVLSVLGPGSRAISLDRGSSRVATDKGSTTAEVTETDLRDPLLTGTYRLVEGRLPQAEGEVAVNPYLASRGPGIGELLEVADGPALKVVGLVENAEYQEPGRAWSLPGAFDLEPATGLNGGWLIDTQEPVTWSDVLKLNRLGAVAVSRDVLENPGQATSAIEYSYGPSDDEVAIYILIVIMALLEVVLLAGPSFAVGARRMQGQLAIVAANGGTPRQLRRAVLAMGVVVGALAAGLGVLLGVPLGWALSPVAQQWSSEWFGPLDVPWLHLLGIASFGFISALLAAIVPAWIASRQDVVQVLSGRRGDRKPGPTSPIFGLVLIGVGLWLTWQGVRPRPGMGETWIGFGAVFAVLGTVLLVPVFLAVVGRLASRTFLPLRYAVRDAARHRARTVPAIGAALASVAGVVALGIAVSSDEAQNRETYQPRAAMGTGAVYFHGEGRPEDEVAADWTKTVGATHAMFPDAVPVNAVSEHTEVDGKSTSFYIHGPDEEAFLAYYDGGMLSGRMVGEKLPAMDLNISDEERVRADQALADGRTVVFADHRIERDEVEVNVDHWDASDPNDQPETEHVTLPAYFVEVDGDARAEVVFPPAAVERLGAAVRPVGLVINEQVTVAQEKDLAEALNAISEESGLYVERGYERDALYGVMLGILVGLGSLLMLGGTLTATFLALSDARPDLATLSAVGAAPRTRRVVAAAYALVIGGIGAVLGAIVGFVPGIAATWPLTSSSWMPGEGSSHTIDVPWLLISAVVLGLPLFTALVVGLFATSRLPVVARID
ncbi:FtsX-like permease family protein [Nocardioides cavernaquae]|uniref:FtsX-like permease family protein n=1 Tax=Nocardioides cavernaquae TaxID=2321396 RepID=A0A3A5H4J3_9ACTN|nr:FtsX-like permease family protein [Nocardioides cavernaquae]RJS45623.1 FtsX-like permease family protein [Nocardioides cavernaquae]